jgi:hypothetical protein
VFWVLKVGVIIQGGDFVPKVNQGDPASCHHHEVQQENALDGQRNFFWSFFNQGFFKPSQ